VRGWGHGAVDGSDVAAALTPVRHIGAHSRLLMTNSVQICRRCEEIAVEMFPELSFVALHVHRVCKAER